MKIKECKPENIKCILCYEYLGSVGFIYFKVYTTLMNLFLNLTNLFQMFSFYTPEKLQKQTLWDEKLGRNVLNEFLSGLWYA